MSTERKVTIIEPISQKVDAESTTVPDKLRVAAYARVSTEQDEQQSSYEAQVDFYTGVSCAASCRAVCASSSSFPTTNAFLQAEHFRWTFPVGLGI